MNAAVIIIPRQCRPRRAPGFRQTGRDETTLTLVSNQSPGKTVLNEVAAQIWDLCDGSKTFDEILIEFSKTYRYKEHAEQDAALMLQALETQNLLKIGA